MKLRTGNFQKVILSTDAKRIALRNLREMYPDDREEVLRAIVQQAPDDESLDRMARALSAEINRRSRERQEQSRASTLLK